MTPAVNSALRKSRVRRKDGHSSLTPRIHIERRTMGDLCMRARLTRRTAAAAVLALLSAALMVFGVSGAGAITQTPNGPETLPATDTPMWQTNGAVWATVVRNGVLFVGGDFTS